MDEAEKLRQEGIYVEFVYDLASELMDDAMKNLHYASVDADIGKNFKADLADAMTAIAKAQLPHGRP